MPGYDCQQKSGEKWRFWLKLQLIRQKVIITLSKNQRNIRQKQFSIVVIKFRLLIQSQFSYVQRIAIYTRRFRPLKCNYDVNNLRNFDFDRIGGNKCLFCVA
jgi:hypothetical protein